MTPTHANKGSKRYRYYFSASLIVQEGDANENTRSPHLAAIRVPAGDLEALTLDRLRTLLASQQELADALGWADLNAKAIDAALTAAAALAQNWRAKSREETLALVRMITARVVVEKERVTLHISQTGLLASLGVASQSEPRPHPHREPVTLAFKMAMRRAGKEKRLIIGDQHEPNMDPGLFALVAKSIAIRDELFSGCDPSVEAMTERLGVAKGYVASLIRLSYLTPAIVGEILGGRQPLDLTPTRLLKLSKDLPHGWLEQRRYLGF